MSTSNIIKNVRSNQTFTCTEKISIDDVVCAMQVTGKALSAQTSFLSRTTRYSIKVVLTDPRGRQAIIKAEDDHSMSAAWAKAYKQITG
jgi:predicted ATPase